MGKTVARHIRAALTMILGRPPTQEDLDGNNNQTETDEDKNSEPAGSSDGDVQIIELEEKVKEIIDILDDNENDPNAKTNNDADDNDKKKIKKIDPGEARIISKFLDVRLGKESAWIFANFRLRSSDPDVTLANFEGYDGIVVDKLKLTAVKQENNDVIASDCHIQVLDQTSDQTSDTVIAVVYQSLVDYKRQNPEVEEVILKSDNAG